MGKTEIIQELARLSPEELAEVRARLDQLALERTGDSASAARVQGVARIRSPRLADRSRARDFVKQVTELPAHG